MSNNLAIEMIKGYIFRTENLGWRDLSVAKDFVKDLNEKMSKDFTAIDIENLFLNVSDSYITKSNPSVDISKYISKNAQDSKFVYSNDAEAAYWRRIELGSWKLDVVNNFGTKLNELIANKVNPLEIEKLFIENGDNFKLRPIRDNYNKSKIENPVYITIDNNLIVTENTRTSNISSAPVVQTSKPVQAKPQQPVVSKPEKNVIDVVIDIEKPKKEIIYDTKATSVEVECNSGDVIIVTPEVETKATLVEEVVTESSLKELLCQMPILGDLLTVLPETFNYESLKSDTEFTYNDIIKSANYIIEAMNYAITIEASSKNEIQEMLNNLNIDLGLDEFISDIRTIVSSRTMVSVYLKMVPKELMKINLRYLVKELVKFTLVDMKVPVLTVDACLSTSHNYSKKDLITEILDNSGVLYKTGSWLKTSKFTFRRCALDSVKNIEAFEAKNVNNTNLMVKISIDTETKKVSLDCVDNTSGQQNPIDAPPVNLASVK